MLSHFGLLDEGKAGVAHSSKEGGHEWTYDQCQSIGAPLLPNGLNQHILLCAP